MNIHLNNSQFQTLEGRLKYIRALSGFTRKELEQKYSLPEVTLKKWETGTLPRSKKGVERCLGIYKTENIFVTREWLEEGIGSYPRIIPNLTADDNPTTQILNMLKEKYYNSIEYEVTDESMLPKYEVNEVVIGKVHDGDFSHLHNKDCIVMLKDQTILLRKFIWMGKGKYSLIATNTLCAKNSVLMHEEVNFLAPVLWHKLKE